MTDEMQTEVCVIVKILVNVLIRFSLVAIDVIIRPLNTWQILVKNPCKVGKKINDGREA
jgi:hypothetical protein